MIINFNKTFLNFFAQKEKKLIQIKQTNKQNLIGSTNTEKINKMQRANGRSKRRKKRTVHI